MRYSIILQKVTESYARVEVDAASREEAVDKALDLRDLAEFMAPTTTFAVDNVQRRDVPAPEGRQ